METLGKLLGNPARVKIMRLFLLNRTTGFKNKDVVTRSRINAGAARKEITLLSSVGFIKKGIKKNSSEWFFNGSFKYAKEFEDLLIGSQSLNTAKVIDNFKSVGGKVKLLVVSGIFIKNDNSRVDLLIVGDKMKRGKIDEGVKKLEAEIGTELTYAVFDSKEFTYRLSMYDKLVRDILDFPHEVVIQGKGFMELSTQLIRKP